MTEHQLRDKLISVAPSAVYANESEIRAIVDLAKTYADARVAQECKVLDETVTLLHQTIANRNVEIAELKADLESAKKRVSEAYSDLGAMAIKERLKADAELKRLRDGIQDAVDWLNNPDDNVDFDELLQSLLSPAPVTETQNEDQE